MVDSGARNPSRFVLTRPNHSLGSAANPGACLCGGVDQDLIDESLSLETAVEGMPTLTLMRDELHAGDRYGGHFEG